MGPMMDRLKETQVSVEFAHLQSSWKWCIFSALIALATGLWSRLPIGYSITAALSWGIVIFVYEVVCMRYAQVLVRFLASLALGFMLFDEYSPLSYPCTLYFGKSLLSMELIFFVHTLALGGTASSLLLHVSRQELRRSCKLA